MKSSKTVTTVLDEIVTLDGTQVFVTMTDKFLSGWGCAEGKIAKRVIICQNWDQADEIVSRLNSKDWRMTYVNETKRLPKYSASRYTVSYQLYENHLFRG